MGFLYVLLVIIGLTSVSWFAKLSARKGVPPFDLTFVLFLVATILGVLFLFFKDAQSGLYSPQLWIISVIAGFGGAIAVFVFNYAIRIGHFGFSNAIYRSSFMIPVIYSIIFFNTNPDFITAMGICLVLISIFLMSWSNESFAKGKRNEMIWFLAILSAFILSGLPRIGQLLTSAHKLNSSAYLFASYAAGLVILLIIFVFKRKISGWAWVYGSLAAVFSYVGVYCTLEALNILPAFVVFPITLSAPIILGMGISFLYKEKIRYSGLLGSLLGITGISILAFVTYYK